MVNRLGDFARRKVDFDVPGGIQHRGCMGHSLGGIRDKITLIIGGESSYEIVADLFRRSCTEFKEAFYIG